MVRVVKRKGSHGLVNPFVGDSLSEKSMYHHHQRGTTIDQEGLMWCRNNTITVLGAVLGVLIIAGCSGHSVRYGANSEGDGESASQANSGETEGMSPGTGYMADGQGGYTGGMVNGSKPSTQSNADQTASEDATSATGTARSTTADIEGVQPSRSSNLSGADYGHNYSGVSGSGPNHGGVDGFGQGTAGESNPDPEAWANAYLRDGDSSQDFYGDPSKMGASLAPSSSGVSVTPSSSPDPVNPSSGTDSITPNAWADTYAKENGGPSPEYVNPDMQIAKIKEAPGVGHDRVQDVGHDREMTHMSGSTGFRGSDGKLQDIYFAFDSWAITPQGARDLERGAQWLQSNPGETLTIEGHCDQRGTQDYNLVLGKKRAEAAREYLEKLGIDSQRIKVVSYGKERPFCENENEDCFQANRRSHMVIQMN